MYKLKSNRAAKKRFFITTSNKVIRKRPFKSHNLSKKSRCKKYFLSTNSTLVKIRNINKLIYIN